MSGYGDVPEWVAQAERMPVAFAQVREDSLLDIEVLERTGERDLCGMMIASGGCTAAALAASGRLSRLHLVDVNPAQLALTRLKLYLLRTAAPLERLQLLGHAALPAESRKDILAARLKEIELPPDVLGPPEVVAALGPDRAGRYELLFSQLRAEMAGYADDWKSLLGIDDDAERSRLIAPSARLGRVIDLAFDRVMALPNLVRLFSAQATRNSREPFARHFARQTRAAIGARGAAGNPYLWQLLLGHFSDGPAYPWLNAAPPRRWPHLVEVAGPMTAALREHRNDFHFIHLSNILDWLSPPEARDTLSLSFAALRPGGLVLIRQLNSTLDLPGLGDQFDWLHDEAGAMHARDRSFFYRSLHLGRKR